MRTNSHTPAYIFAVNNTAIIENLRADGIVLKDLQGSYKGQREDSWLIDANDWHAIELPATLADDGQESVLYLDNQRNAWLYFAEDGYAFGAKAVHLGPFREAHVTMATLRDAWTRDLSTGKYYVAG